MTSLPAAETLLAEIEAQGNVVRTLKSQNASNGGATAAGKEEVGAAVKVLNEMKKRYEEMTGVSLATGGGSKKKETVKFNLKTPKGTKDWHPSDMLLRQTIFRKITEVFELHGGVTIDTPVFELKEILSGKYGEDSKLIYDLQDQGGELCSLRYDLTVPFARFLAMNGSQYPTIKRYHIAKVYRRDQPVMSKGRMREFYQCDFDIAGVYDPMLPDSEILAITCQVLESLEIGSFTIKVNHRKILDGLFNVCGVPSDKIRTISSAVDKLDKMSWADVRKEMTEDKGLDGDVADRIGEYVKLKGGAELVDRLRQDERLMANKTAREGLDDMTLTFKYLDCFGCTDKISFDLSLARGLDYYTGIIYEAVTEGSAPPLAPATSAASLAPKPKSKASKKEGEEAEVDESSVGVGSIAAGGRYDNLVGMFSASNKIPCVGISFGVERLFSILQRKRDEKGDGEAGRGKATECFVMSLGDGMLLERMQVAKMLWDAGIKTEFTYKVKPKVPAQFATIDKDRVPFAVIVSPDEWKAGTVRVKEQVGKEEGAGNKGEEMKKDDLVKWLLGKLERS